MTYYDEIAEGYDELHAQEQRAKAELILQNLPVEPDAWLLDVGCGTGKASTLFACKKVGVDPAAKMLKYASFPTILSVAEALPFADDTFDFVISITAIHNFSNPEQGLREMRRVGKQHFAFSVLKTAASRAQIEDAIARLFHVKKRIEEEKDVIYICQK
jgi:ubiquinone/menaquinone biosynthesis C-methylase UbiE